MQFHGTAAPSAARKSSCPERWPGGLQALQLPPSRRPEISSRKAIGRRLPRISPIAPSWTGWRSRPRRCRVPAETVRNLRCIGRASGDLNGEMQWVQQLGASWPTVVAQLWPSRGRHRSSWPSWSRAAKPGGAAGLVDSGRRRLRHRDGVQLTRSLVRRALGIADRHGAAVQ